MKTLRFLMLLLLLCPSLVMAGEIKVEIIDGNPQEKLEVGIMRTVYARSLSKGVNVAEHPNLNICLTRLGTSLSLDAVIESTPPQAFHRDLASIDQLSGALDEMLTKLYQQPAQQPSLPTAPTPVMAAPQAPELPKAVNLPFKAVSLTVLNDTVYVASANQIYSLVDNKPVTYWRASQLESIFRLYSYQDSLIVITGARDRLSTYRIKDKAVTAKWNTAVVPSGEGLISASLSLDSDFTSTNVKWGLPGVVEGNPAKPDMATDILSLVSSDILAEPAGPETLSFTSDSRLTVYSGKNKLWTAEVKAGHMPPYIEKSVEKGPNSINTPKPVRYYPRSRLISLSDGSIICAHSTDSFISLMKYVSRYANNAIVHYNSENGEIVLNELVNLGGNYCADLAVNKDQILYLSVGKSKSQLKFEKLP